MTQQTVRDIGEFLPYLLNIAAEECGREFQQVYKNRYGMLRNEWRVLFHLGRFGPMSATQICDLALLHKTKVSRAVTKLAEKRYVSRTQQDTDRRVERLELTRQGNAVFHDLSKIAIVHEQNICADFTKGELIMLKSMLRKLSRLPAQGSGGAY